MSEKKSTVYAILCCKQRHHDGSKKRKIVFGNNKDKLDCMKYKENFSNLMHGEPCLQKWVELFPFKGEILNTQQAFRKVVFFAGGCGPTRWLTKQMPEAQAFKGCGGILKLLNFKMNRFGAATTLHNIMYFTVLESNVTIYKEQK